MSIKTFVFCDICGCGDEGPLLIDSDGNTIAKHKITEFRLGDQYFDDPDCVEDNFHICRVCLMDIEQKLLKQLDPLKLRFDINYINNGITIRLMSRLSEPESEA